MMNLSVLLVEDDPSVRAAVASFLCRRGWAVTEAASLGEADVRLTERRPDAALLDYSLPDGSGLDLLARLRAAEPEMPVVLVTGHATIDLAVRAVKEGAEQFFTKPVDLSAVEVALRRAIENARNRQARRAGRSIEDRDALDPFVGESPAICGLRKQVEPLLLSPGPVLLLGETGSGKGILARWIHRHSPREREPFVDLNCAGLGRELLESELFGFEKGAFTSAGAAKPGLLEVADRGTFFLDEVGDLPADVQPKLLTAIDEHRFRRLGAVRDRRVDVRLLAATHRDLESFVAQDRFRADLYFRLSTFPVRVPALRERRRDILLLARNILERVARELGRGPLALTGEGEAVLLGHPWPGNVRELRNVLERAALYCGPGPLEPHHLFPTRCPAAATPRVRTLAEAERVHLEAILNETGGNVEAASLILGLSRSALYEKMRKHGLTRDRSRATATALR